MRKLKMRSGLLSREDGRTAHLYIALANLLTDAKKLPEPRRETLQISMEYAEETLRTYEPMFGYGEGCTYKGRNK